MKRGDQKLLIRVHLHGSQSCDCSSHGRTSAGSDTETNTAVTAWSLLWASQINKNSGSQVGFAIQTERMLLQLNTYQYPRWLGKSYIGTSIQATIPPETGEWRSTGG